MIIDRRLFLSGSMAAIAAPAAAQSYPDKPISMIVGFAAGGTQDIQARALAKFMSAQIGQPIAVVNRPGAGSAVAAAFVKNSAADGYTLYFDNTATFTFNPLVNEVAYKLEDFRLVGGVSMGQPAIVVKGDSPLKNFGDFIERAKSPAGVTYASQTLLDRMMMRLIMKNTGANIRILPTTGNTVALVLGGQVDCAYSGGIHANYTDSGQMRLIAALNSTRLSSYPDVPTLKELGHDIGANSYRILVAPGGTPAPVLAKLEALLKLAVADPEFKKLTEQQLKLPAVFTPMEVVEKRAREMRTGFGKLVETFGKS